MDFSGLFISTGVVALAEIGDKTQLLSLMLAARYPKHAWPIVWGIFLATMVNHVIGSRAFWAQTACVGSWELDSWRLVCGYWSQTNWRKMKMQSRRRVLGKSSFSRPPCSSWLRWATKHRLQRLLLALSMRACSWSQSGQPWGWC